MTDSPLVSIVIPVYNGSNYLAEAIESALSQTYKNIEVIVVNDGSNDNHATRDVAMTYENQIRYFEKENGGVSSALNLGIKKMEGDYFSWLSHDDLYDKNKIEYQIDFMINNKIMGSYCQCRLIDLKGKTIGKAYSPYYSRNNALKELIGSGYINGCSVMLKSDIFNQIGEFNEELKYVQDTEMWFRILNYTELLRINKVMVSSRIHDEQTSILKLNEHNLEINNFYKTAINSKYFKQILKESELKALFKKDYEYEYYAYQWLIKKQKNNNNYMSLEYFSYEILKLKPSFMTVYNYLKYKLIRFMIYDLYYLNKMYVKRFIYK